MRACSYVKTEKPSVINGYNYDLKDQKNTYQIKMI